MNYPLTGDKGNRPAAQRGRKSALVYWKVFLATKQISWTDDENWNISAAENIFCNERIFQEYATYLKIYANI